MRTIKMALAAAVLTVGLVASASAMPVSKLDNAGASSGVQVDQVRLVCNRYGRCWRTGGGYGYGWNRGWHRGGWHRGWHRHW